MASASTGPALSGEDILEAKGDHVATLIFMHGLGDTARGWLSDLRAWHKQIPGLKVIAPTAPVQAVTLNGGARMTSWMDIIDLGRLDGEADQLDHCVSLIEAVVEREAQHVPRSSILVGGFSQGAAMALTVGFAGSDNERFAGVIALSGYLPRLAQLSVADARKATPALLCHGDRDNVVAYAYGASAAKALRDQGVASVDFKTFRGLSHGVVKDEMTAVFAFLSKRVKELAA